MCNKVKRVTLRAFKEVFGDAVVEGMPASAVNAETPELETGYDRPGYAVMVSANPQRFIWMEWGLLPRDLDRMPNSTAGQKPILNAKAETIFKLPSFSDSIKHRRCIIPLQGFYEHQHREVDGKRKGTKKKTTQAFYVENTCGMLFAAGIWDEYQGAKTFAIITTDANPLMRDIHNTMMRQPHQIDKENWERWFSASEAEVPALLAMYPDENMKADEYHPPKPQPPATPQDDTLTLF